MFKFFCAEKVREIVRKHGFESVSNAAHFCNFNMGDHAEVTIKCNEGFIHLTRYENACGDYGKKLRDVKVEHIDDLADAMSVVFQ